MWPHKTQLSIWFLRIHVLAALMFASIVHDQHFPKNLKTREENIQMKIWETDIFFCIVHLLLIRWKQI